VERSTFPPTAAPEMRAMKASVKKVIGRDPVCDCADLDSLLSCPCSSRPELAYPAEILVASNTSNCQSLRTRRGSPDDQCCRQRSTVNTMV